MKNIFLSILHKHKAIWEWPREKETEKRWRGNSVSCLTLLLLWWCCLSQQLLLGKPQPALLLRPMCADCAAWLAPSSSFLPLNESQLPLSSQWQWHTCMHKRYTINSAVPTVFSLFADTLSLWCVSYKSTNTFRHDIFSVSSFHMSLESEHEWFRKSS